MHVAFPLPHSSRPCSNTDGDLMHPWSCLTYQVLGALGKSFPLVWVTDAVVTDVGKDTVASSASFET